MYKTYVIFIIQYCAKIVSYVIPSVILTWTPVGKKVGNWDEIDCLWQLLHCCLVCLVHEQHAHQWSRQVSEQCCPSPEALLWAGQEEHRQHRLIQAGRIWRETISPNSWAHNSNFLNYGTIFLYSELIFLFLVSFFRLLEKCALRIQENSLASAKPVSSSLEKYAIRQSILFS